MAQDEHFLNSSNSGGSGSGHGGGGPGEGSNSNNDNNKSRNVKQKKVPQRGLGVAQLERLRLEEQRDREARDDPPQPLNFGPNMIPVQAVNALTNNAIGFDPSQPLNFGPNMIPAQAVNALTNNAIGGLAHDPPQSPNFIPDMIPAPVNLNFGPPNASNLYRPVASNLYRPAVGPSGTTNVFSWSRVWSGEYNSNNNNIDGGEGDKQRVDHHDVGFTFNPQINLNLQYEPNGPGLPVSESGPQRSFQFQRPPSSSVTAVGMKRAYSFNLESPHPPAPMPSFLSNFHASGSRSDEFRSCINEPGTKPIRDGQLILTPSPEQNPVEDTRLIGDFLTLAPPVAASTPLSLKNKHPMDLGRQGLDLSDNRSLSSQGFRSHQAHRVGPSASTEQSFSFFPIKPQTDQTCAHVRNARDNNEEKEEKLDLDLKL